MELCKARGGKMSWALAEKLKAVFPDVELFPRAGTEPAGTRDPGPGTGSGEQGTAAPGRTAAPPPPPPPPGAPADPPPRGHVARAEVPAPGLPPGTESEF